MSTLVLHKVVVIAVDTIPAVLDPFMKLALLILNLELVLKVLLWLSKLSDESHEEVLRLSSTSCILAKDFFFKVFFLKLKAVGGYFYYATFYNELFGFMVK